MKHFITVTFEVPDYHNPAPGQRRMTPDEAIEQVRKQLLKLPYSWTLDEYERDPSDG